MAESFETVVPPESDGQPLRRFLGDVLTLEPLDLLAHLVESNRVRLNGAASALAAPLRAGDVLSVDAAGLEEERQRSEYLPLEVLYEDGDLLLVNKPAGCGVMPGGRSAVCPFFNGVLAHLRGRPAVARAMIAARFRPRVLYRLDRDTTGAVMVAISREGELYAKEQFREQRVRREYFAVVRGELADGEGRIEAAIGYDRRLGRMRVDDRFGKAATTEYAVAERFRGLTRVRAFPISGRRHQTRVHFAHIGHPVLADASYGGGEGFMLSEVKRRYRPSGRHPERPLLARQALHAAVVTFMPVRGPGPVRVEAPLPHDLEVLLKQLRKWA